MDVIRTVASFDTGLTLAFWLVTGEQAIYARHASRVLAPQRLMELPEQIPGAEASQFRLLGTRRFLPFFLTQFLGAFNDNLFRNAVVVSITFGATVAAAMPASCRTYRRVCSSCRSSCSPRCPGNWPTSTRSRA
jgi:hypothetical protein